MNELSFINSFNVFHEKIEKFSIKTERNPENSELVCFLKREREINQYFKVMVMESAKQLHKKSFKNSLDNLITAMFYSFLFQKRELTSPYFYKITDSYNFAKLSTLGCQEILSEINTKKKHFQYVSWIVCENAEDAENDFKQFLKASSLSQKKCFLIHHSLFDHFTPVFMEQYEPNKFRVIITDSLGYSHDIQKYVPQILSSLKNALEDNKLTKDDFSIFVYDVERQKDDTNCCIFSIRDAIQFAKNPLAVTERILNQKHFPAKITCSDNYSLDCFLFYFLPPEMMKVTQSLSLIKEDEKNDPLKEEGNIIKELEKKDKLIKSSSGIKNAKIDLLFQKYLLSLMEKHSFIKERV